MRTSAAAASVVLVLALVGGLRGLRDHPYQPDERMWIYVASRTLDTLLAGEWDSPYWSSMEATWGYPNPPIGKYLLGLGLRLQKAEPLEVGTDRPPEPVLAAGRRISVLMGAIGALGLLWIGRRTLSRGAAFLAAGFFAVSPLWLLVSRQAMTDVQAATLTILACGLFLPVLDEVAGRRRPGRLVAWTAASGLVSGLAVGTKLNAASTPVALGLALLFLLGRELARPGGDRPQRSLVVVGLGLLFGATSLAGFVLPNPYLHEDAWARFQGILDHWVSYCEGAAQRAAEGGMGKAFYPHEKGLRVGAGKILFPLRPDALLLLLPLVAVIVAGRVGPRRAPGPRLIGWLVLIPVSLWLAAEKNQLVSAWFPWVGLLGLGLSLVDRRGSGEARTRAAAPLLLLWGAILAFFVWKMTFFHTTRYYLPLLPVLCLGAGYALAGLRTDLRDSGGALAVRLFDVSVAAGLLSVLAAPPDYLRMDLKHLFGDAPPAAAVLHWTGVVALASGLVVGIVRGAQALRRATPSATA